MVLKEKIKKLLEDNDFDQLEYLLNNTDLEVWDNVLIDLTFDDKTLISYSLICMMLVRRESPKLHSLASALLSHSLCHIQGAYASALYHIRKAIELDSHDIGLKEALLFFHEIPDKLVSDSEAKKLIDEILKEKPSSKCALGAASRMPR